MKKSVFLVPALLATSIAHANQPVEQLPDTLITASRQLEARAAASTASTVFTRSDIERLQPQDLPELLARVPGLHLSRSGGTGSLTSVFLRGTATAQTLVLVDGQRIAGASAGVSRLAFLPIDQIERVEVIRGGRSALYGSDAIGGVIQIFTRRGNAQGLNPRLAISAGSHGTWQRSAGLSAGNGRTRFNLAAALDEIDGFERTTLAGSDNSAYRNKSLSLSLSHKLTEKTELGFTGMHQEGKSEFDYDLSPAAFAYTDFSLSSAQTYLQVQLHDIWRSRLELGHSEDRQRSTDPYGGSVFSSYRDQANWLNYLTFGNGHKLTTGLEWYKDSLNSSEDFSESTRTNKAVFVQHQFEHSSFGTELGWRHDDNQQFGSNNSWNAAFTLHANQHNDLILSYSESFRAPTFNDLYYPDSCFPDWGCTLYANPDLKPETAKSYEVQWRSQIAQDARFELSLYRIDITDAIVTHAALDGNLAGALNQYQPDNIDAARINGLEAVYTQNLLDWQGSLSYSLIDARNRSGGGTDGNRLPRRPQNSLKLDLDRQFGSWSFGLSWALNSDSYNDLANTRKIPGYGVLDLRSNWQATDSLRFSLSLKNLLDRDYHTATGTAFDQTTFAAVPFRYREGGRTALLGMTWTPQP